MKLSKACYRAAKAKIENIENWTQNGVYAEDEFGDEIGISELPDRLDEVVKCCAYGAVYIACNLIEERADELDRAANILFNKPVTTVNDNLDHTAVLQMFDKAIELAEE